jgi:hypothetical protein
MKTSEKLRIVLMKPEKKNRIVRHFIIAVIFAALFLFLLKLNIIVAIMLSVVGSYILPYLYEKYGVKYQYKESWLNYFGLIGLMLIIVGIMFLIWNYFYFSVRFPTTIEGMIIYLILITIGLILIYFNWKFRKHKKK